MYTLTIFKKLVETYPIWTDLKNYLESAEGGKLIITPQSNDNTVIIHYNKSSSDMSIAHTKWFKSVVWDITRNIPISISTPCVSNDNPIDWISINDEYVVDEYLEGVTFSVYMNTTDNTIRIASRTKFDANGKYYSNKSFNELILDALKSKNNLYTFDTFKLLFDCSEDRLGHISSFATILLQHPDHIVVEHVKEPKLYLLQQGYIYNDGSINIYEYTSNTVIDSISSIEERPAVGVSIKEWFDNMTISRSWDWRGIVIKNMNGDRWRIRSDIYNMIRMLRGNTPMSNERFFNLRSLGLVKAYLMYYPEDSNMFWAYEQWIRKVTDKLYTIYINVNKAKTVNYNNLDIIWKSHITALQIYYYNTLKPMNKTLVRDNVIKYINELPVPRLMHLMNMYNMHSIN